MNTTQQKMQNEIERLKSKNEIQLDYIYELQRLEVEARTRYNELLLALASCNDKGEETNNVLCKYRKYPIIKNRFVEF